MNASKSRYAYQAFVIEETDLSQLDKIIRLIGTGAKYEVGTKDEITFHLESVDEVINLANPSTDPIVEFRVRVYSADGRSLSIRASKHGVSYDLSGIPADEIHGLSKQLDDWMSEVRPWYSRISTAYFLSLILPGAFVLFILGIKAFFLVTGQSTSNNSQVSDTDDSADMTVILIFSFLFIIGLGISEIQERLFPVVVFGIGHGKKRKKRLENWRTGIGTLVILAIILGIITDAISNWIL